MDKQEKGTERLAGGIERLCRKRATQFSYDSWTSFFSLCASSDTHSWSFRLLEAGERHPPLQNRGLCCVAHREERQGGRERCEKRCEERNYEFSAWKVQVLLEVNVTIGTNWYGADVSLHCPSFMINLSVTYSRYMHSLLSLKASHTDSIRFLIIPYVYYFIRIMSLVCSTDYNHWQRK